MEVRLQATTIEDTENVMFYLDPEEPGIGKL